MVSAFLDAVRPVAPTVATHEGGEAYEADKWSRLRRFLLIGTSGGTFYVGERDLTLDNLAVVKECLAEDGPRTIKEICAVSDTGRAPKHDPVLFALAMATVDSDKGTRRVAYSVLPEVCRTGTHILHMAAYREALGGGWGRGFKGAVAKWFASKTADQLAYQAIKYPSRDGWSLRDLLRLTKPKTDDPALNAVFRYIAKDEMDPKAPPQLWGVHEIFTRANGTADAEVPNIIRSLRMPREAVPSHLLNDPNVWDALLQDMPMTAMIRNLGKMSAVGLLTQGSDAARVVRDRLEDAERLRKARVHPISILSALKVYEQGHGERGSLTWRAVKSVVTALDEAFYLAFGAVEPTGKRILVAIDVSSSMAAPANGLVGMTCRDVAAAMALVTVATEPNARLLAFNEAVFDPEIRPTMRLDEVRRIVKAIPGDGTDCSAPIYWAIRAKEKFDAIIQYTDAETRNVLHGRALAQYRSSVNKKARNVQVISAANNLTLADPNSPLDLDCAGFDSSVPTVVAEFIAGRV